MEPKPSFALSTVAVITLIAFAIGFCVGLGVAKKINPCVVVPTISVQRDTITVADTVRGKITPPVIRTIIRRDTLRLPSKQDTSKPDTMQSPQTYVTPSGDISVPIEQKVYATASYRAVVSGWHPNLDSIEVYQKNRTITATVTKLAQPPRRNWAVTVGPSATYTTDKKFLPGASVVIGFVIGSWH